MVISQALFVIVYLALLVAYFFTETSGNFRRRAANKIAMASLFLVCGCAWFFINGYSGWRYLALFALFFAWLGDVLLLWSFVKGGISFLIGNLFFILYASFLLKEAGVPIARIWWCVLLFLLLLTMVILLARRKWINFGKLAPVLILYLATVTGHGSLGLGLASSVAGMHALLLGMGLAFFMISDYFLMSYQFKFHTDAMLRCNSGTYFFGMLLVALSFSF